MVDDPQDPGAHRDIAIQLLNAETRDRQPQWVTADGCRTAHVTIDEYSDIKLSLFTSMLKWLKAGRAAGERGTNVM